MGKDYSFIYSKFVQNSVSCRELWGVQNVRQKPSIWHLNRHFSDLPEVRTAEQEREVEVRACLPLTRTRDFWLLLEISSVVFPG